MALYVVAWHYVDNTGLVDRVRPQHRNYLRGVADSGRLRARGRPFSRNNAIARYDAWEWSPLIGPIKG